MNKYDYSDVQEARTTIIRKHGAFSDIQEAWCHRQDMLLAMNKFNAESFEDGLKKHLNDLE